MLKNILSVLAALFSAFIVMMAFEFTNSLLFPFPEGFDYNNLEDVRAFTQTLPWIAFIMVLLGWAVGSLAAGWVVTKIAKTSTLTLPIIVGVVLTLLGIANLFMFQHPVWFMVVGTPLFIIFTLLGHKLAKGK